MLAVNNSNAFARPRRFHGPIARRVRTISSGVFRFTDSSRCRCRLVLETSYTPESRYRRTARKLRKGFGGTKENRKRTDSFSPTRPIFVRSFTADVQLRVGYEQFDRTERGQFVPAVLSNRGNIRIFTYALRRVRDTISGGYRSFPSVAILHFVRPKTAESTVVNREKFRADIPITHDGRKSPLPTADETRNDVADEY